MKANRIEVIIENGQVYVTMNGQKVSRHNQDHKAAEKVALSLMEVEE
jgi:hypothetical protein